MTSNLGLSINVANHPENVNLNSNNNVEFFFLPKISGNTGSVDNIIESQMGNKIGLLQEQREGLTNTTSSTANSYFNHI